MGREAGQTTGEATYDTRLILDGHGTHDIASYFQTSAEENGDEVIAFVDEEGLDELDGKGD